MRGFNVGGIFRFCEENKERIAISTIVSKPYSAKEARIKNDYSLINVFEDRKYSMTALGDSSKRKWGREKAQTFGDLLSKWWTSKPHRQVQDVMGGGQNDDMGNRPEFLDSLR